MAAGGLCQACCRPWASHVPRADPQAECRLYHRRLAAELDAKGVLPHSFLRVVGDYYDHSLEWRRECLGAPSVFREPQSSTAAVGGGLHCAARLAHVAASE